MPAEIGSSLENSVFTMENNEEKLLKISSNSDSVTALQNIGAKKIIHKIKNNNVEIEEKTLNYVPKDETETIHFSSSVFNGKYKKKLQSELASYSLKELKVLTDDLSKAVEEISNQLVKLLLENDALQQESDARNVAIEQLLKMTVKVTENELKPVQMSVILSSEECETSL